jgi:hypothetical protein
MKNSKLTKKQRLAIMLKLLAHESSWNEHYDETILELKFKSDEKTECMFWVNNRHLETFFNVCKACGITSIHYAHQNCKDYKEITGKDAKENWNQYVAVGTL